MDDEETKRSDLKRFLTSRGIVKEEEFLKFDFKVTNLNSLRFEGTPRELITASSIYKATTQTGLDILKETLASRLAEAKTYECVTSNARDSLFIDDVQNQGSAKEPVWADNGITCDPASLLLPPWERLKVEKLKPLRNYLWIVDKPYRKAYNNCVSCVFKNFLFIANNAKVQISDLDSVVTDVGGVPIKRCLDVVTSFELYCADEGPKNERIRTTTEFRCQIHFMKIAKFYERDVLCLCTLSGLVLIFFIDELIKTMNITTSTAVLDEAEIFELKIKPFLILSVPESCWAIDIYDIGDVKFIALGHNGPGVTVFAHRNTLKTMVACEILIHHNVPAVSFVKKETLEPGLVFLSYASIFGDVGTLEITFQDRGDADCSLAWKLVDVEYLAEWCWTITPLDRSDFQAVSNFEYLSNDYNRSHKSNYLEKAFQDSMMLRSLPSRLAQSSGLGIGATIAQVAVPVSNLRLTNEYPCNDGNIGLRFTTFNLHSFSNGGNSPEKFSAAAVVDALLHSPEEIDSDHSQVIRLKGEHRIGDCKVAHGIETAEKNWSRYPFAEVLCCGSNDRQNSMMRSLRDHFKIDTDLQFAVERGITPAFVHFEAIGTSKHHDVAVPEFYAGMVHDHRTYEENTCENEIGDSQASGVSSAEPQSGEEINEHEACETDNILSADNASPRPFQRDEGRRSIVSQDDDIDDSSSSTENASSFTSPDLSSFASDSRSVEEAIFGNTSLPSLAIAAQNFDIDVNTLEHIQRFFRSTSFGTLTSRLDTADDETSRFASHRPAGYFQDLAYKSMRLWSLTNYVDKVSSLSQAVTPQSRFSAGGPRFELPLANETFFLVTTSTKLYLMLGNPLIVNAYTADEIFPIQNVSSCGALDPQLNRISIVCHIRELNCFVVASQIGLISLMRLTTYKGIHAFRQEYILGWESQVPGQPDSRCMRAYTSDDGIYPCHLDDTIFEMNNITGLAYKFHQTSSTSSTPDYAVLYVTLRKDIYRFKIFREAV
ncbi:LAMI_0G14752g1_1 [Lachancea mirantina]|uniref:LAMI_0G14752g1_1 n=1 Tax=Lachancea mirantina TaxID=1230905 RepID=A0A1G4KC45_9SACH|nr:LAMI_0G14752g1_1 [Lachancea mirantina]